MLEAVKQIRLYGKVLNTIFEEMSPLMNSLQKEYLKLMQEAYCLYSKKNINKQVLN